MSTASEVPFTQTISQFFTASNALLLAGGWLSYKVLQAVYNISPFHPLNHIPGPKLAAATYAPEFYYDVILNGRYTRQIGEWHKQFGERRQLRKTDIFCIRACH
jgi:hypothetical protein